MRSWILPFVFDYYTGGGIDVSILSFAEIDADGSVNVSRFGDLMPGCGGFIDITQNARRLVFCGAFSSGGKVAIVGRCREGCFPRQGFEVRSSRAAADLQRAFLAAIALNR